MKLKDMWISILVLLFTAATSAGIVYLLSVLFFKKIDPLIPLISASLCLLGFVVNYLIIRRHPAPQKRRELLIVFSNYLALTLSILLFAAGVFWDIWILIVMIALFVINTEHANNNLTLLFFNVNTIFALSMSSLFNGLLYAHYISDDWGTLVITAIGGYFFTAFGFVLAIISLLLLKAKHF